MLKYIFKCFFRSKRQNESWFRYIVLLLHLWLGLLSSVIIFIVCFTGALYAFKNQIKEYANQQQFFVEEIKGTRMSPDQIQSFFKSKKRIVTALTIPEEADRNFVVKYKENGIDKSTFFNPYTGQDYLLGNSKSDQFFEIILDIHRNLLLGNVGRQIVGVNVLIFVALLFSGFILWFPRKLKYAKQSFSIKWNAKFYRVNYDLHKTLGFYAMMMLLFIGITGLYITYPWVKNALIVSLGGEPLSQIASFKEESDDFSLLLSDMLEKQQEKKIKKPSQEISLETIFNSAYQQLPFNATTTIELPNENNPRYVISKMNTNNWLGIILPDQVTYDKQGTLKTTELFADKPLNKQFTTLIKPLHTGEIAGLPSIILYFIACLIGCSLPVTGFFIWWQRIKKIKKT